MGGARARATTGSSGRRAAPRPPGPAPGPGSGDHGLVGLGLEGAELAPRRPVRLAQRDLHLRRAGRSGAAPGGVTRERGEGG